MLAAAGPGRGTPNLPLPTAAKQVRPLLFLLDHLRRDSAREVMSGKDGRATYDDRRAAEAKAIEMTMLHWMGGLFTGWPLPVVLLGLRTPDPPIGCRCRYRISAMPESAPQGRFLTIRATPADRALVKAEAQRRGISQTQLIKDALINAGVPLQSAA